MQVYQEFHRGLRLPTVPGDAALWPSIFQWYWKAAWCNDPAKVGQEWCNPANLRATHKIWEYVQVLACLYYLMPELRGRAVLSLGAGVESPLWSLARWGATVTAGDIYADKRYWHPEQVGTIRTDPSRFCPYTESYPVQFRHFNLKCNTPARWLAWRRLGLYDAIYSISSLEHIYGVQRRGGPHPEQGIVAKKLALFVRIARHVRPGGILAFTTELITRCAERRRQDFYTREELDLVLDALAEEGLVPVDDMDWGAMEEQELATRDMPGHYHTAVAIALRKAGNERGGASRMP